jgi:hypothetical protein
MFCEFHLYVGRFYYLLSKIKAQELWNGEHKATVWRRSQALVLLMALIGVVAAKIVTFLINLFHGN